MLTDIDQLILTCRTDQARFHISEAYAAYKGGAYRAAIIATWTAVVFDILDKVRELSITGDANAKAHLAKFEGHQEQLRQGNLQSLAPALEFERSILEMARDDFSFFDTQQLTDLFRLREDRNRCAHPTFQGDETSYQPSAELARLHLRNAIEHVLRQPPLQGKAAAGRIEQVVLSEYFPTNVDKAKVALRETEFARPTESLTRLMVDRLLFGIFEKGAHFARRQSITALDAIVELERAVAEPRLLSQFIKIMRGVGDDNLRNVLGALYRFPQLVSVLSDAQLDRIRAFIKEKTPLGRYTIKWALEIDKLKQAGLDRIAGATKEDLALFVEGGVRAEAVPRAVALYSKVGSWDEANFVAEKIIHPLVGALSESDVRTIIAAPSQNRADLAGSRGFTAFLKAVKANETGFPSDQLDALLDEYNLGPYMPEDENENDEGDEFQV